MQEFIELLLNTPDGPVLAVVLFSAGIGIGAAFSQVSSIVIRKGTDAVTSLTIWPLLLTFSLAILYYFWHHTDNYVLIAIIAAQAASAIIGLIVSLIARRRLAEVAASRRQQGEASLVQNYAVMRAAMLLKKRLRTARGAR